VVQVKRETVRNAILDSAHDLFSERGYHATTLTDIAELAGTGVSSLYSYFPSKIHLFYAVFEPWYRDGLARLERRAKAIAEPREKLRCILLGIWRDMPAENVGLANSHMEALASADPRESKPSPLLRRTEEQVLRMLKAALPASRRGGINYDLLPNLLLMAYDGFVINRRLNDIRDIEALVEMMCDILLGSVRKKALQG
jgi:AcrR family transcriptional regulator